MRSFIAAIMETKAVNEKQPGEVYQYTPLEEGDWTLLWLGVAAYVAVFAICIFALYLVANWGVS